jgi:RNA-directed DNA polymerase
MPREKSKWRTHKGESTDAGHRDGAARSSDEALERGWSEGAASFGLDHEPTEREERVEKAKPFDVSKRLVWEAYKLVRENKGAAGVDRETIEAFSEKLRDNLYKLWNRMSSGSYFPPPVRTVSIEKRGGGERRLGIPTVADRIAQAVVKMVLEPVVDPVFHVDSYGYRPGKSALEAVGTARRRCWKYDWVIDLDIKGFFDNLDHELVLRAVRKHTDCRWVLLYIERWLKAPAQLDDGSLEQRTKGTPQGGVISPLLANAFLHHAFDGWMKEEHSDVPFERYADDIVIHCATEHQARSVLESVRSRLRRCKLELHPEKTRIVYCRDDNRRGGHPDTRFDFLGYEFRPRSVKGRTGKLFVGFTPAISPKSLRRMYETVRGWRLHRWSDKSLEEVATRTNPAIRGWINYYGRYSKSALGFFFYRFNRVLTKWARRKHKRLRRRLKLATGWLARIARSEPALFAHWALLRLYP